MNPTPSVMISGWTLKRVDRSPFTAPIAAQMTASTSSASAGCQPRSLSSVMPTSVNVMSAGIDRSMPPRITTIVCPAAAIPRMAQSAKTERIDGRVRKPSMRAVAVSTRARTHTQARSAGALPGATIVRSHEAMADCNALWPR